MASLRLSALEASLSRRIQLMFVATKGFLMTLVKIGNMLFFHGLKIRSILDGET